jgi:hypothetical protein
VKGNLEENEIVKTPTNTLMLSKIQGSAKLNEARPSSRAPPATKVYAISTPPPSI